MRREVSTDELAARLRRLDTCVLADALDSLSLSAAELRVRPMADASRIAGPVLTVVLDADSGVGVPDRPRHLGTAAIESAQAGAVILVAHRAPDVAAGWGGLLSIAAQQRAVAGVVVTGLCRDVDDFVTLGFPVWAHGSAPRSARGRVVEVSTGEPVDIDGTTVQPGDWLVADRTGAVTIPASEVIEVLELAERLTEREALMASDLRAGLPVTQVLGKDYETLLTNPTVSPEDRRG